MRLRVRASCEAASGAQSRSGTRPGTAARGQVTRSWGGSPPCGCGSCARGIPSLSRRGGCSGLWRVSGAVWLAGSPTWCTLLGALVEGRAQRSCEVALLAAGRSSTGKQWSVAVERNCSQGSLGKQNSVGVEWHRRWMTYADALSEFFRCNILV
jgi:hypothetical protein